MAAAAVPDDLEYTQAHEWVAREGDRARVGITDYAQEALGDIVFVTLPEVGATLVAGDACGEVESTKSVSEIYAPVNGTVVAVNEALDATPELVNSDPYGAGWLFTVEVAGGDGAELLSAASYRATLG